MYHQLMYGGDSNQTGLWQSRRENHLLVRGENRSPPEDCCISNSRLDMRDDSLNTSEHNFLFGQDFSPAFPFTAQPHVESRLQTFEDDRFRPVVIDSQPFVMSAMSQTQYLRGDERFFWTCDTLDNDTSGTMYCSQKTDANACLTMRGRSLFHGKIGELNYDALYFSEDVQETTPSQIYQHVSAMGPGFAQKPLFAVPRRMRLTQSPDSGYGGTIRSRASTPSCLSEAEDLIPGNMPHRHADSETQTPTHLNGIAMQLEDDDDSVGVSCSGCKDIESYPSLVILRGSDNAPFPRRVEHRRQLQPSSEAIQSPSRAGGDSQRSSMPSP